LQFPETGLKVGNDSWWEQITGGHWRVGLGYSIVHHYDVYQYYKLRWVSLFKFVKDWYTRTEWVKDDEWYLLMDGNGHEANYNGAYQTGRVYAAGAIRNIYWENRHQTDWTGPNSQVFIYR
jgi:hypothetical protein